MVVVLYDFLIEYVVHCETYEANSNMFKWSVCKVHVERHLSDVFPTQCGLKQDVLLPLLFSFALEYVLQIVQEQLGRSGIEWDSSASGLC